MINMTNPRAPRFRNGLIIVAEPYDAQPLVLDRQLTEAGFERGGPSSGEGRSFNYTRGNMTIITHNNYEAAKQAVNSPVFLLADMDLAGVVVSPAPGALTLLDAVSRYEHVPVYWLGESVVDSAGFTPLEEREIQGAAWKNIVSIKPDQLMVTIEEIAKSYDTGTQATAGTILKEEPKLS